MLRIVSFQDAIELVTFLLKVDLYTYIDVVVLRNNQELTEGQSGQVWCESLFVL